MRLDLKIKDYSSDFISSTAEIRENSQYGKYWVAKCPISAGQVICEEYSLMIGPSPGRNLLEPDILDWVCLTCYRKCGKGNRCAICHWPICDAVCQKGVLHSNYECRILATNEVIFENSVFESLAIRTLRCLLLRENDPVKWETLLSHDAQLHNRLTDASITEAREYVIDFLLNKCQLTHHFDVETIERVMGILAINEFCLTNDYSRNALLIFHNVSYFAHSCAPNTETIWKFHPTIESSYSQTYFSIKFFASRDIAPGEMLTHSYILDSSSVQKRQTTLAPYYFYCDCEKCRVDLFNEICKDVDEIGESYLPAPA